MQNNIIKISNPNLYLIKGEEFNGHLSDHSLVVAKTNKKSIQLVDEYYMFEQAHHWLINEEFNQFLPVEVFWEVFGDIFKSDSFFEYWALLFTHQNQTLSINFEELIINSLGHNWKETAPELNWKLLKEISDDLLYTQAIKAAYLSKGDIILIAQKFADKFIEMGQTPLFNFEEVHLPEDFIEGLTFGDSKTFFIDLEKFPIVKESILNQTQMISNAEL